MVLQNRALLYACKVIDVIILCLAAIEITRHGVRSVIQTHVSIRRPDF